MSDMKQRAHQTVAQSGFTLLEVMITVAIVAILSSIAYASYDSFVVNSRRAAAATCLQERAQFMERYYSTYLTYNRVATPPVIAQCGAEVAPFYQVGILAGSLGAKSYTLQAAPQGIQATRDTGCGTLTLNAQGVRGVTGSKPVARCW